MIRPCNINEDNTKINKTKVASLRIDKSLANSPSEKGGIQVSKIRNEKGEVKTDTAEIHRIVRDCCKQLYGNKTDNLEEMDKFLRQVQPKSEPGRNRK